MPADFSTDQQVQNVDRYEITRWWFDNPGGVDQVVIELRAGKRDAAGNVANWFAIPSLILKGTPLTTAKADIATRVKDKMLALLPTATDTDKALALRAGIKEGLYAACAREGRMASGYTLS